MAAADSDISHHSCPPRQRVIRCEHRTRPISGRVIDAAVKAVFADTGPLYAALDPSDQHHDRAAADIEKLNAEGFRVTVLYSTLLEGYTLALYKLGARIAQHWLAEIHRGAALLNPQIADYQEAANLLLRFEDQRISLFDAVLATVSQRLALPIWSFDHHFEVVRAEVWRG